MATLARNVLSGWLELIGGGILGILLTPITIRSVGADHYGLWIIILSITSQFLIFEQGIRQSIISLLPRTSIQSSSNISAASHHLSVALSLVTVIVGIGCLIILVLAYLGNQIFSFPAEDLYLFRLLLILAFIDVIGELYAGPFFGAVCARNRFDLIYFGNFLRLCIGVPLILLGLHFGGGILVLAVVHPIFRTIHRVYIYFRTLRFYPGIHFAGRLRDAWSPEARHILSFSGWSVLSLLAGRVIYQVDPLLLGIFLGPSSVTEYALVIMFVEQIRLFGITANGVFVPHLSRLFAADELEGSRHQVLRWSNLFFLLAIGLVTPFLVTGGDFIRLWVGPNFTHTATLFVLLMSPFYLLFPALPFLSVAYAKGVHHRFARLQTLEAMMNVSCSLLLIPYYGVIGTAIGTLVPSILCSGLATVRIGCRMIGLSLPLYIQEFAKLLPWAVFQFMLLFSLRYVFGAESWNMFFLQNFLGGSLYICITYRFLLTRKEQDWIHSLLRKGLKKH